MSAPKRPATYQDVLDAPEHVVAEILEEELVLSPRPAGPHSSVTSALHGLLFPRFDGGGDPGGWIILIEPELHLGKHVVVPDLAGWRRERMPGVEDVPFFTLPPDWVCETLSKSTEQHDRGKKLRIYAQHGVGHAWLINPMRRMLEVYRRQERAWLLLGVHADDDVVRAEPFDAIELDLSRLWANLVPKPKPTPGRASEPWAEYEVDL